MPARKSLESRFLDSISAEKVAYKVAKSTEREKNMKEIGRKFVVELTPEEVAMITDALNDRKIIKDASADVEIDNDKKNRYLEEVEKLRGLRNGMAGLIHRSYCGKDF